MRTAYLGTSEFAAAVLRPLAGSAHRPALVVSRPDRPRGRGRRLGSPPAVELARELGIEVCQPESVNGDEARARIAAVDPQRLVVCAFGALVSEPLLSEHGRILNVHPSLLPRWRGAAPIERAILAGEDRTGVSIMELRTELDSGPVCLQEPEPIAPDDDYGSLSARLAQLGAELLLRVLDDEQHDGAPGPCVAQDEALATYAEKLGPADRRLDPARPVAELARRVRALSPHVGAHLEQADGTTLGIWQARPVPSEASAPVDGDHQLGQIVLRGGTPLLACADGLLELVTVQPAGGRRMAAADYARGLRR